LDEPDVVTLQGTGADLDPVGLERTMTSRFVSLNHKQSWLQPACLAVVSLAAAFASGDRLHAASARKETAVAPIESRTAGEPIMAIVSLRDQRITVYDENGIEWPEGTRDARRCLQRHPERCRALLEPV